MWNVQISVFYYSSKPSIYEMLGINIDDPVIGFDSLNELLAYLKKLLHHEIDFHNFMEAVKTDGKAIKKALADSDTPIESAIRKEVKEMLNKVRHR